MELHEFLEKVLVFKIAVGIFCLVPTFALHFFLLHKEKAIRRRRQHKLNIKKAIME